MAGQLRFNFISPRHEALPFAARVDPSADEGAIIRAWLQDSDGPDPEPLDLATRRVQVYAEVIQGY